MLNNIFIQSWLSKKWQVIQFFFLKNNFLWTQLGGRVFWFFHPQDPKPKRIHQIASNRANTRSTQRQKCVKYGRIVIFLFREIQMSTQVIWKYKIRCIFLDVIFNFSKTLCVLPSTLCMTGELWPRRFIWHQDIMVTYCQSSAMSLSSSNTFSVTHSDTASYWSVIEL